MFEYFRHVEDEGEELVVTHNNVPVLKVVPLRHARKVEDVLAKFSRHGEIPRRPPRTRNRGMGNVIWLVPTKRPCG
jgi:antitoxin (DNA-binding transcriptional repressor) of toxin-antitoxin stability system